MADYVLFVVCCLWLIHCVPIAVRNARCHCLHDPNRGIPLGIEAR
jgi:hypothetical protein